VDPRIYWEKAHLKYSQADWIFRPTIFATQVVKYLPKTGRLLDLGAGQGQDSLYFADRGYRVVATDFSEFALSRITDSRIQKQLVDLSHPLPFSPGSFDVVYSHLALHYFNLKRTQNLFDEIYQILKPNGIFATLTNTVADPEITEATLLEPDFYESGGIYKHYFSVDSMARLTHKFNILLLDGHGQTYKDKINTLIRFVGRKPI
jgi:SAM-dependent methyltransferase